MFPKFYAVLIFLFLFLSRKKDKHNERKLIWKRNLSKCLEIFILLTAYLILKIYNGVRESPKKSISKILNCCDYKTKTIWKLLEREYPKYSKYYYGTKSIAFFGVGKRLQIECKINCDNNLVLQNNKVVGSGNLA